MRARLHPMRQRLARIKRADLNAKPVMKNVRAHASTQTPICRIAAPAMIHARHRHSEQPFASAETALSHAMKDIHWSAQNANLIKSLSLSVNAMLECTTATATGANVAPAKKIATIQDLAKSVY